MNTFGENTVVVIRQIMAWHWEAMNAETECLRAFNALSVSGSRPQHPCKYFYNGDDVFVDRIVLFVVMQKLMPEGVDGYDLRSVFEGVRNQCETLFFWPIRIK